MATPTGRSWRTRVLIGAIAVVGVALAVVGAITARPPSSRALTWNALRNATYPTSVVARGAALHDGAFEQEAAPGSASRIIVRLADIASFGDLDGAGDVDAAVILMSSGGGTGTFVELAAVRNDAGTAHPIASALLGDRVLVREVRIQDRAIVVRLRARGATDPFSLRSQELTRRYVLDAGRLVQTDESRTDVVAAPADDYVYRREQIDVALGATTRREASLPPGQIASYVLHARPGDVLDLSVRSEFDNAVLSVAGLTDGVTLVSRQEYAVDRALAITTEQDYTVKVVSLAGQVLPVTLTVTRRSAPAVSASPRQSAVPLPSRTPSPTAPPPGPVVDRALREGSTTAATFARTRAPIWGVAAYVPSRGVIYTENADEQVPTASVVKVLVMLVVLEQARAERRPASEDELALLWPMITESDNDATSQLWEHIGRGQAVASYLRSIAVTGFTADPGTSWGVSFVSARAMATVLGKLLDGQILDATTRALALRLLDSVIAEQRWGVTAGADTGDRVGLKNGWYPGDEGWRVNSVGIVRPANASPYSIAIVTDERVSFAEGVATIEGIARAVNADLR